MVIKGLLFLRVLTVRVAICPGMTGTVLVLNNKLSIFPIKYLRTGNVRNQTSIIYVDFIFYQTFLVKNNNIILIIYQVVYVIDKIYF